VKAVKLFRVGYYLLMSILLIAALGTGRWEFYFVLSVMVLLVAVALIMNIWVYFSFSYKQELLTSKVVKGDSPILKIRVFNNKPFSFVMMRIKVETPTPSNRTHLCFSIGPGADYSQELPLPCEFRGEYMVGMSILETGDVFGILRMRFDLRRLPYYRLERLTVYPALIKLPAPSVQMHGNTNYQGVGAQLPSEDGESFYDTRIYHYGDPFKRIHRITSARKRQLFVKRYDMSMAASVILIVDTCKSGLVGEDSLRYSDIACECAAAIAHFCLRIGYMVALAGSDENGQITESANINEFSRLYDYLAVMKFDTTGDVISALHVCSKMYTGVSAVYVISSRDDQPLTNAIAGLVGSGSNVSLIRPVVQSSPDEGTAEEPVIGPAIEPAIEPTIEPVKGPAVTHVTGAHDLIDGMVLP